MALKVECRVWGQKGVSYRSIEIYHDYSDFIVIHRMGVGFNRPEHTWSTPKIIFLNFNLLKSIKNRYFKSM